MSVPKLVRRTLSSIEAAAESASFHERNGILVVLRGQEKILFRREQISDFTGVAHFASTLLRAECAPLPDLSQGQRARTTSSTACYRAGSLKEAARCST